MSVDVETRVLLTREQAAELLGVSTQTLDRVAVSSSAGFLPARLVRRRALASIGRRVAARHAQVPPARDEPILNHR